jgi:hypothetical protein
MTARFVLLGYDSVAAGRRACQAEADKTPVKRYRVWGAGPYRRGIHWRRGRSGDLWTAEKRYENLVLTWTGSEAKRTDRGFDRLDGILRRAVDSAG